MEINKQLFEDILSGKLKGTFVLRRETKLDSSLFKRNNSYYSKTHLYRLKGTTYTSNGLASLCDCKSIDDIIDFIPDTDMKENELKIEIPDGKTVDWDESKKQNKIVLKDKQLTYSDIITDILDKHQYEYISPIGELFLTSHIRKCLEAKNKLTTVAKYLNNGWKPDLSNFGYFICVCNKELEILERGSYKFSNNIIFKSKELAQQAIEILGEETVKFALEPLGI